MLYNWLNNLCFTTLCYKHSQNIVFLFDVLASPPHPVIVQIFCYYNTKFIFITCNDIKMNQLNVIITSLHTVNFLSLIQLRWNPFIEIFFLPIALKLLEMALIRVLKIAASFLEESLIISYHSLQIFIDWWFWPTSFQL